MIPCQQQSPHVHRSVLPIHPYGKQHCDSDTKRYQPPPRSKTIPLPSTHIPRTQSELQLREDMAAAEWRDLCMFNRLVSGIQERHHAKLVQCQNYNGVCAYGPVLQTERSLENIILTRHQRQAESLTPYESSVESSLADDSCSRFQQLENVLDEASGRQYGAVGPSETPSVGDDWSLTGYEESSRPLNMDTHISVIQPDEDQEGDVFSMDL